MRQDTIHEQAFRRRMALLALLHRRPHCYEEIIASLDQKQLFIYDREENEAKIQDLQRFQFRHDLQALKILDFQITFDRSSKCYTWSNSPFGFSLDQSQLNTLALLRHTFADPVFPRASEIRSFLSFLINLLPPEQQKTLQDQRPLIKIDLRDKVHYQAIDASMLREIDIAVQGALQLEFIYCAPYSGKERRHVIEPQPLKHKDGHVYLYGRSIEGNKELNFRLDYIVPGTVKHRSISATHNRPFSPSYLLRYTLTPAIARHNVSKHFEGQQEERHFDGSVTVTARTSSLFEARRILLSYGINCIVHEPPELVAQMRLVRDHFNESYPTPFE